jgi:diacylglycerol kinase (ATP)
LINATLIYNPAAGRNPARREAQVQAAAAILWRGGIETALVKTAGHGSAKALAREAVSRPGKAVIVCGGDGTINEAINGMAGSATPLGILPGGTANTLARELGIPHNPVAAAEQLSRWQPRRIPLGRAQWRAEGRQEQRYFLSLAGVGFDAQVVRELSLDYKARLGVMAYVGEAIEQIWRYQFPKFACHADGREYAATFAVAQRTSLYGGWFHLAPRADFFKPVLTTCLFQSAARRRYLVYAVAVLLRRHSKLKDVTLVESSSLTCRPATPGSVIYFELDGELAGQLPVVFDVVPEALTLLSP